MGLLGLGLGWVLGGIRNRPQADNNVSMGMSTTSSKYSLTTGRGFGFGLPLLPSLFGGDFMIVMAMMR